MILTSSTESVAAYSVKLQNGQQASRLKCLPWRVWRMFSRYMALFCYPSFASPWFLTESSYIRLWAQILYLYGSDIVHIKVGHHKTKKQQALVWLADSFSLPHTPRSCKRQDVVCGRGIEGSCISPEPPKMAHYRSAWACTLLQNAYWVLEPKPPKRAVSGGLFHRP